MKKFTSAILASLFLISAAPAYSETLSAIQIFRCVFIDKTISEDEVVDLAEDWLKAAKQTKGGENMRLVVRFPMAIGAVGTGDFTWVISMPTFAEWGTFTDNYEGSAVSKVDDRLFSDLADCGQSAIWEGIEVD